MEALIRKILADCDEDIREAILADSDTVDQMSEGSFYKTWQLMHDPCMVALQWQSARDWKRARS